MTTGKQKRDDLKARLGEALKANLQRRKEQARERRDREEGQREADREPG